LNEQVQLIAIVVNINIEKDLILMTLWTELFTILFEMVTFMHNGLFMMFYEARSSQIFAGSCCEILLNCMSHAIMNTLSGLPEISRINSFLSAFPTYSRIHLSAVSLLTTGPQLTVMITLMAVFTAR
jgi:hypothetical protein